MYLGEIRRGLPVRDRVEVRQTLIYNAFIDNLDTQQEVDIGVLDLVGVDECSLSGPVDEVVVLDSEGTTDLYGSFVSTDCLHLGEATYIQGIGDLRHFLDHAGFEDHRL